MWPLPSSHFQLQGAALFVQIQDAQITEPLGELDALAAALDMMKETTEKTVRFYKHAMNKHVVSAEAGFEPSYDPGVGIQLFEKNVLFSLFST